MGCKRSFHLLKIKIRLHLTKLQARKKSTVFFAHFFPARGCGVSLSAVDKWEHGNGLHPSVPFVHLFLVAFGRGPSIVVQLVINIWLMCVILQAYAYKF